MKQSDYAAMFPEAWGASADAQHMQFPIPSSTTDAGRASLDLGFPPATMTPPEAGGSYPYGADVNGGFRMCSTSARNYESGIIPPWSSSFAQAISGYPAKSIVADPATVGAYWVSTADDNLTTPGASDASWQSLFAGLATQSFAEQFSPGRLLSINNFTNGQTYTPLAQARKILVEIAGAGGAGGGAFGSHANSPSASACGGAGASGGFARILIDLTQVNLSGGIPLVVGGGGQCDYGIAGGGGSYSSFGNYLIANGGDGGKTTGSTAAGQAAWCAQSLGGTVTYGAPPPGMTVLDAITGANGMSGFLVPNGSNASVPVPPVGADAPFGTGGSNGITQSGQQRGETARGFGAGGGGMGTQGGDSVAGGTGAPGLIRIWEFS